MSEDRAYQSVGDGIAVAEVGGRGEKSSITTRGQDTQDADYSYTSLSREAKVWPSEWSKLRFVSHFLDTGQSTRAKELEDAARRSHAARVAHRRRRDLLYAKAMGAPRLLCGNSDPFATSPIPITAKDHDRMQAYRSIVFHIMWPSRGNVVLEPMASAWTTSIQSCLTDKSSAEALLALCLVWVIPKYPDLGQRPSYMKELLRHRAASLSALRAELAVYSNATPPPLTLIMAVIFLTVGLAVAGENEEASIHLQGLRRLVDAYGGFRLLPYLARGSIMGVDHAVGVAVMRPLAFSTTVYDPPPLKLSKEELREYDNYLNAQPPLSDGVPPGLRVFILFHRDMIAVLDIALNCEDSSRRTELLQWVLLRRYVPQSETQEKCCAVAANNVIVALNPVPNAHLALEASVRVAAQYMFRLIYFPLPGQTAIFADFNVIQESLAMHEVRTLAQPDLLLWLMAVSACIERALRLTRHRKWWHAPRFLLLAQEMNVYNADEVCQITRRLAWYDVPLRTHIESLFDEKDAIYEETGYALDRNYQRVGMDGALTISWSNKAKSDEREYIVE